MAAAGAGANKLTAAAVAALLERCAGLRVVVVGDVFLDEYWVGRPERLSREGPVPVLAFQRRFCLPGGAANPARNMAALGAKARQVGVVGADAAAEELRRALAEAGIDAAGLVTDPSRPTTVKTRIVAEGLTAPQQVARIDRQVRADLDDAVAARLVAALAAGAAGADAILVSHYRSGVATPAVRDAARAVAADRGIWLTVDAQGDLDRFAGFHVVRVGRLDAANSLGRHLESEDDFAAAGRELRARLGARVVILGRGPRGMSVVDEDGHWVVRPANVSEVYDVAGAGDTVIAVVTLALAAGAGTHDAVWLANTAAGIAVRRLGVAAPTAAEILAEIDPARRR